MHLIHFILATSGFQNDTFATVSAISIFFCFGKWYNAFSVFQKLQSGAKTRSFQVDLHKNANWWPWVHQNTMPVQKTHFLSKKTVWIPTRLKIKYISLDFNNLWKKRGEGAFSMSEKLKINAVGEMSIEYRIKSVLIKVSDKNASVN